MSLSYLPYVSVIGSGVATSVAVGKKASKTGQFNFVASTGVAVSSTVSSVISNAIIDNNYNNLMERQKAQTTEAYVQQLSDEELEQALVKFDLLEDDNNDVKVL